MSIKREIVSATQCETQVVSAGETTLALTNGDAVFARIRSASTFLFLGNASDGDEIAMEADTWHRLPCYHQTLYLKQVTTAGLGAIHVIWEK
jgi:hypothetical protein